MGKVELLPINGVEQTGYLYQKKIKVNPYIIAYIKINSKWVEDLNVRSETVRLLKENIE